MPVSASHLCTRCVTHKRPRHALYLINVGDLIGVQRTASLSEARSKAYVIAQETGEAAEIYKVTEQHADGSPFHMRRVV